ncbi:hypothetical protein X947_4668 [Burkholderia pseudomallei MSHR7334]|nr:hypothetical protein X947_4668 [Burkholderia pseudomallei MSHR7334]
MLEYPPRAKGNFDTFECRARVIKKRSTGGAVSYPVDFQSFAWITFPKLPASRLWRRFPIARTAFYKTNSVPGGKGWLLRSEGGESGNEAGDDAVR